MLAYVEQIQVIKNPHMSARVHTLTPESHPHMRARVHTLTLEAQCPILWLLQRKEREHGVETLTHQKWSGAELMDTQLKIATGGTASTLAMGAGVTEDQFGAKH